MMTEMDALEARLRRVTAFCTGQQRELGLSDADLRALAGAERELTAALAKLRADAADARRLADARRCHAQAEAMLGAVLLMVDGRPRVSADDKRSLRMLAGLSPEPTARPAAFPAFRPAPIAEDAPAWRRLLLDARVMPSYAPAPVPAA
jgi:hypothetical protein